MSVFVCEVWAIVSRKLRQAYQKTFATPAHKKAASKNRNIRHTTTIWTTFQAFCLSASSMKRIGVSDTKHIPCTVQPRDFARQARVRVAAKEPGDGSEGARVTG